MALISNKGFLLCRPVVYTVKRFRGKINLRRPKPPHFERARYEVLTTPYFINPKKDKSLVELCSKVTDKVRQSVENPFQAIIAGELRNWFENSRMIVFYHMNSMNADEQYKAFVAFKKEQMHYKNYGKKTLEMAIKGTRFESVLDFYASRNMTVFGPEPKMKKVLQITKKFKQLILLAGIVEGKFLSKEEFTKYSLVPNLQTAQSGLVQTLNSIGNGVVSQLNTHQSILISNLQERMKQLEEQK